MSVKRHAERKKNRQVKRSSLPIKQRASHVTQVANRRIKKRKEMERLIATVTQLKKEGGARGRVHEREETNMIQMKK